ncbi:MAG: GT4 family glycosyltransferase PelF [Armatimonadetes bacterium]|nr:GT4 family glycosyltransferase PelF [Armatimonadota bacterium]
MTDVAMILEGTYPYVAGGVSSWVHALITGMPDVRFGLIFIAANREWEKSMKFTLPPNVDYLLELYVYEMVTARLPRRGPRKEAWDAIERFYFEYLQGKFTMETWEKLYKYLSGDPYRALDIAELAFSYKTWERLVAYYRKHGSSVSFVDFYWTWRFAVYPIFQLFCMEIPFAKVYHAICTGWAGLIGVMGSRKHKSPLILTEHGIYTNERKIEISQSEWIYTEKDEGLTLRRDVGFFKELWINIFLALGKLTYDKCSKIYTLYGGNKKMETTYGANPDMIEVIPNGVKIDQYIPKNPVEKPEGVFIIGFVGRVVPIKDVKTFIRACRIVVEKFPNTEIDVIGPYDEDKEYSQECMDLTALLGLSEKMHYLGKVDVKQYYPKLDVLVLTSVSEGQPLVILEGYCSGVPVVATDVGACSEIVFGLEPEDKALGPSGFITRVGSPQETAEAIIKIFSDPELMERMRESGRQRVRKYYNYDDMIKRYHDIYDHYREEREKQQVAAG